MPPRSRVLLGLAVLSVGCDAWTDLGGGAGMQDIQDVSGAELVRDEREVDRAEDQAEVGLRFSDEGTVEAGGTEEGEVGIRTKPSEPDAGIDFLVPPVELPDEPL